MRTIKKKENAQIDNNLLKRLPNSVPIAIDRIIKKFNPMKIILFGSWARGDAKPDSDVDLLIVFQNIDDKRKVTINIGNELSDLPLSKDIVVTTPEEIEKKRNIIGLILNPALSEGKVLYEH